MRAALPPLAMPSLGSVVGAVVFSGIRGSDPSPRVDDWVAAVPVLIEHRLAGVAMQAARINDWDIPSQAKRDLADASFDWTSRSAQTMALSADAPNALRDAGISFAVTKGVGIAAAAGNLSLRPFTDLDLVVPQPMFRPALEILEGLDYQVAEKNVRPWRYYDTVCQEAINLHSPRGGAVDIHHRVPPWFWTAKLDAQRLIEGARNQPVVGGGELPVVSLVHNLLVSALHVVSDRNAPGASLMAWRDVALLATRCPIDEIVEEATAVGLSTWLAWVLRSMPSDVADPALITALQSGGSDMFGRRRLRLLTSMRPSIRQSSPQVVLRLPVINAVLFLVGMAMPSKSFVRRKRPVSTHPYLQWWFARGDRRSAA